MLDSARRPCARAPDAGRPLLDETTVEPGKWTGRERLV